MLDPLDKELERRGLRFARYADGWLNYFGISHTYREVLELDSWIRRRVRMCCWKQWKRPGTRRRHLLSLGIRREEVHLASRSRRGYWWMDEQQRDREAGVEQRLAGGTGCAESEGAMDRAALRTAESRL